MILMVSRLNYFLIWSDELLERGELIRFRVNFFFYSIITLITESVQARIYEIIFIF